MIFILNTFGSIGRSVLSLFHTIGAIFLFMCRGVVHIILPPFYPRAFIAATAANRVF